jgi:outer membrane protein TolC
MTVMTTVALALLLAQAPDNKTPPPAAAPAAASADAVPPEPAAGPVVTIDEALQAAGEKNYDLKALGAQLQQAREITWKALALYLPQVTVSGSYTRQEEVKSNHVIGVSGGPTVYDTVAVVPYEYQRQDLLGVQVKATQMLISPQLFFAIDGAKGTERTTVLTLENGRRQVLFGVARAYYGAAALKQQLDVSARLLEIARRQEHDARVRYQAGAVARVALIRAEIDRARAEQDLKRARNDYLSAKVGLATLLGRDVAFEVDSPPEPVLATTDGAALEAQALQNRPDVQAAKAKIQAEEGNRKAVLGRYLPSLQAFGQYQWANQLGANGQHDAWAGGLLLQWSILDGFRRESDYREASALVDEAVAKSEGAVVGAQQEVQQALLDLDSARANAIKAKEQRDLAAENQRLVDVAYRAGTSTAVEQADATAQLRTAEIGYTSETLNAQLAALQVLNAIGTFNPRKP